MAEGQPPGEAAVAGLDALPNVSVEQRDPLEQLSRNPFDDFFDLLRANRVRYRESEIEVGGRRGWERLVPLYNRRWSLE
jgi:hypothetical protein